MAKQDIIICNKVGAGSSCLKCEHGRAHEPVRLNDGEETTCKALEVCMVWIDGRYMEIRVKCK